MTDGVLESMAAIQDMAMTAMQAVSSACELINSVEHIEELDEEVILHVNRSCWYDLVEKAQNFCLLIDVMGEELDDD